MYTLPEAATGGVGMYWPPGRTSDQFSAPVPSLNAHSSVPAYVTTATCSGGAPTVPWSPVVAPSVGGDSLARLL